MEMKDLLGGKGANLAEMTSVLELPVPGGFTISTDACRAYLAGGWPSELDGEISKHVSALEKKMGRRLGDPADPLLVSVRSGAKFSMPGMMDTVLNLGLNDKSVKGLAAATNDERFAYDSYRRFISMYGRIVLGRRRSAVRAPVRSRQGGRRRHQRRRPAGRRPQGAVHHLQGGGQGRDRQGRSRRTRSSSCAAPSRRCSAAGTAPGRSPTASASGSATTSAPPSTCRRWCSATATTTPAPASASPATRRPARTSRTATSSSTPRARTSSPASATPRTSTPSASTSPRSRTSCSTSSPASSATTATCATPSSRSSRASSGCSRPASASAPARRP